MDLRDVFTAHRRIAPYIRRTPFARSTWLSDMTGARVWLKHESKQLSNSFKARGAFNAVLTRLEREHPPARLVTASAGNHGRGLAAAAEVFGLPLVVFTPADAPRVKLDPIRRHGAELRADGCDYDDAEQRAKTYAHETGAEFISPYDDADVIAGAATIALEMLDEAPEIDTVVVPVGGGGLISGIGTVVKAVDRSRRVIGVEVEASHAFHASLAAGRLVPIVAGPTLADGLGGNPDPHTITWPMIQQVVDSIVLVGEHDLEAAVAGLVEHEHEIAEGAGAAATAALLTSRVEVTGRSVAVLVTGANIDRERLVAVLGSVGSGSARAG